MIVDFEIAVHNVVRDLMPSTHLKGCLFHFGQPPVWESSRIGLSPAYRSSEEVRKWFHMLVGLTLLPVPRVVDGYDADGPSIKVTEHQLVSVSNKLPEMEHLACPINRCYNLTARFGNKSKLVCFDLV